MDISVNNLKISYGGEELFRNLSFAVNSGEKVCINGDSGVGKSSVLKALMGLVVPDEGEVFIDGKKLGSNNVWEIRKNIAYVAQEPDLGEGKVIDRIRQPFEYSANDDIDFSEDNLAGYCKKFRLSERLLDREVSFLSGGEKQRFSIIIALMLERPILLLDEPFSAIDKEMKGIVRDYFKNEIDRTMIMVSHEDKLVEIANRNIVLNALVN